MRAHEAKKLCPQLQTVHVQTIGGEDSAGSCTDRCPCTRTLRHGQGLGCERVQCLVYVCVQVTPQQHMQSSMMVLPQPHMMVLPQPHMPRAAAAQQQQQQRERVNTVPQLLRQEVVLRRWRALQQTGAAAKPACSDTARCACGKGMWQVVDALIGLDRRNCRHTPPPPSLCSRGVHLYVLAL